MANHFNANNSNAIYLQHTHTHTYMQCHTRMATLRDHCRTRMPKTPDQPKYHNWRSVPTEVMNRYVKIECRTKNYYCNTSSVLYLLQQIAQDIFGVREHLHHIIKQPLITQFTLQKNYKNKTAVQNGNLATKICLWQIDKQVNWFHSDLDM